MRYLFKHILMRDTVYDMQLRRHLSELHRRAAHAIEELYASDLAPYYADLAYHYRQANMKAQTIEYLHKAGTYAKETYDVDKAIAYYRDALALLDDSSDISKTQASQRKIRLCDELGEVLSWQARFTEAAEAYIEMRTLAERTGAMDLQARAWNRLCQVQESAGESRAALLSAQRAEEVASAVGAEIELAESLKNQGFACLRLGDIEQTMTLGEQCLALSTSLDIRRLEFGALNLLGGAYDLSGDHEQAAQYQERALALCRERQVPRRTAAALNNLGENARLRGDYQTAVDRFQEALMICKEIGDRGREMLFLSTLAGARVGLKQFETAESELREVIQMSQVAEERFARAYAVLFLAKALLGQRKVEEALEAARQALILGQATELQETLGGTWRVLGKIIGQLSKPAVLINGERLDAAMCFARSLHVFTEMGAEGERARTLRAWSQYELTHGDREMGWTMWQEAHEIFERVGMRLETERMDRQDNEHFFQ